METLVSKLFGEGKQLKDLTTEELARYKATSYQLRKNSEPKRRKLIKKKSFAEKTFGKRYIDLTDAEKAMHKKLYAKWYSKFSKKTDEAIPYEEINETQKTITKMAKTFQANNECELLKKVLIDLIKEHYAVGDEVAETLMLGLIYKAKGETK